MANLIQYAKDQIKALTEGAWAAAAAAGGPPEGGRPKRAGGIPRDPQNGG